MDTIKEIPLKEQVTRAVLNNRCLDLSYLMSGCLCHHIDKDKLDECSECKIRFLCYTNSRIKVVETPNDCAHYEDGHCILQWMTCDKSCPDYVSVF